MRGFALLFALAFLLSACDDDSGPTEPPSDFGGAYVLRYDIGHATLQISCTARGTADITQSGSTFTGTFQQTGQCMSPAGNEDFSGFGTITGGSVRGTRVSFSVEECDFDGTVVGTPPNGGQGDVVCAFREEGVSFEMEGHWVVTKGVASVIVAPDSVGVPLDETFLLAAEIRGPDGAVLEGRQVTWASYDPSIATVDGSGLVTGISAGSAVIAATTVPVYPLEEPVVAEAKVSVVLRFASVEAGTEHTCGVTTGGRGFCWGWSADGRLGIGPADFVEPLPREVSGGYRFNSLSPGMVHTCASATSGVGLCWGSNLGGALGIEGEGSDVPRPVGSPIAFDFVDSGSYGTCGLSVDGDAYCWGSNDEGQVGIGTIGGPYQYAPVAVAGGHVMDGLSMTASVGGGAIHVCGVDAAGTGDAWCWGYGGSGELGNGDTQNSGTPVAVSIELPLRSISSGWGHTCAVTGDGDAYCWGYAISGALGTGSTEPVVQPTPVPVFGGLEFESISAGDHFTCGVASGGEGHCWGWGGSNQLGNGHAVDRLEPTPVAGGLQFASISAGSGYACGTTTDGLAYCWGDNFRGQLGTGDQQGRATPTRVGLQ